MDRTERDDPPRIKIHDRRRFTSDGDAVGSPQDPPSADPAPASAAGDAVVAQLTRDLEAARKRVDELARAYQAGERDREDFKQRLRRERDQLLDVEKGNVTTVLAEAIDELDLCLSAATESPLTTGVRLIRDGLLKKAEALGVERVALLGTAFDPRLAEASDMELTATEAEEGKIVAVLRPCYQLAGRVIRPGRVRVAKYVTPAEA